MKKFSTILSKINYFYKLAQSASVGMYDEIMAKANEARQLNYSDLAVEIALIADLYRIAVKNNSGFGVVTQALDNCLENSLDIDEEEDFEVFLNSVFADIAERVDGDMDKAPINNETKAEMINVKTKLNFIGTEDLLRRIQSISAGNMSAEDEIESETEGLSKYDDKAVSQVNLNEGGSKEDGGNNGYEVSGIKTYKNWIDEFKNERLRYQTMVPKSTDIAKRNIAQLFEINDKLLANRSELLNLKTDVSNPNQDRENIDLTLLEPDEELVKLRDQVAKLKALHSKSPEKLKDNAKIKMLEQMEAAHKLIQDTLKNNQQSQQDLTSETPELLEDIKKLQEEGKALQIERNKKKNSIRVYDRHKDIELLHIEFERATDPTRKFLIDQKIELKKSFIDKDQNKREETRLRRQLIDLLENAISDKPKGEALTPEIVQSFLTRIEEAKLKRKSAVSVGVEVASKLRNRKNTEGLDGLIIHFTQKTATASNELRKAVGKKTDPATNPALSKIFSAIVQAKKDGNLVSIIQLEAELKEATKKWLKTEPQVVAIEEKCEKLRQVRAALAEVKNSKLLESEPTDDVIDKLENVINFGRSVLDPLKGQKYINSAVEAGIACIALIEGHIS